VLPLKDLGKILPCLLLALVGKKMHWVTVANGVEDFIYGYCNRIAMLNLTPDTAKVAGIENDKRNLISHSSRGF
jgi:hypothetical protein